MSMAEVQGRVGGQQVEVALALDVGDPGSLGLGYDDGEGMVVVGAVLLDERDQLGRRDPRFRLHAPMIEGFNAWVRAWSARPSAGPSRRSRTPTGAPRRSRSEGSRTDAPWRSRGARAGSPRTRLGAASPGRSVRGSPVRPWPQGGSAPPGGSARAPRRATGRMRGSLRGLASC